MLLLEFCRDDPVIIATTVQDANLTLKICHFLDNIVGSSFIQIGLIAFRVDFF